MIILPSIDLSGGQVVRLKQGDYNQKLSYAVDPLDTATAFAAAGAKWMHLVDLDGAKAGKLAQLELIRKIISAAPALQVEVGGGVRDTDDIDRLLAAGAKRVVVGTRALEAWDWFEKLVHQPAYHGRIVLAVDARQGMIATRAWTQTTQKKAVDVARQVSDWPLGAILYTDVAKDGMLQGPNLSHTRDLALAGKVPVIASGGVGSVDHIRQLTQIGVWGAIVGRSLYEGKVDLKQAIELAGMQG